MNKREALKLALEAFEWNYNTDLDNIPAYEKWAKMLKENITAIREALAQPDVDRRSTESKETFDQQEPVVWMYQNKSTHEVRFQKHMRSFVDHGAWYEVPLYSEPLANQEKTSGSPKPAKTEALRLADAMEYDLDWCDEAAAELRRMHDLLGKANALCRIRAEEIERLKAQPEQKPVAWVHLESWKTGKFWPDDCFSGLPVDEWQPLYTTPPQRKPLTDEQWQVIADTLDCLITRKQKDAIEAVIGIKE